MMHDCPIVREANWFLRVVPAMVSYYKVTAFSSKLVNIDFVGR